MKNIVRHSFEWRESTFDSKKNTNHILNESDFWFARMTHNGMSDSRTNYSQMHSVVHFWNQIKFQINQWKCHMDWCGTTFYGDMQPKESWHSCRAKTKWHWGGSMMKWVKSLNNILNGWMKVIQNGHWTVYSSEWMERELERKSIHQWIHVNGAMSWNAMTRDN